MFQTTNQMTSRKFIRQPVLHWKRRLQCYATRPHNGLQPQLTFLPAASLNHLAMESPCHSFPGNIIHLWNFWYARCDSWQKAGENPMPFGNFYGSISVTFSPIFIRVHPSNHPIFLHRYPAASSSVAMENHFFWSSLPSLKPHRFPMLPFVKLTFQCQLVGATLQCHQLLLT